MPTNELHHCVIAGAAVCPKQYGVAALSAAALVIAAACAADKLAENAAGPAPKELSAQQTEQDDDALMFVGMITCPIEEPEKAAVDTPAGPDAVGGSETETES